MEPPSIWLEKNTNLRPHDFAHSPDFRHQFRLANFTWDRLETLWNLSCCTSVLSSKEKPKIISNQLCQKVALVLVTEAVVQFCSFRMKSRHRSVLLGVRSVKKMTRHVLCLRHQSPLTTHRLNFVLTSVCLAAMQCFYCVYPCYLLLVLLSLPSMSLWNSFRVQPLQFDV